MMKDLPVYPSLEAAVAGCFGSRVRIVRTVPVTGGDISDAACVHLSGGARVFVKSNAARAGERFSAEAAGLAAIASTGTVGTPRLLCLGVDEEKDRSFLMMEMAGGGKRKRDYWERLGRELAGLHGADTAAFLTGGRYGFPRDNFIGSNRQINEAKTSWVEFFRTCRLEPQFRMALRYFEPGMRPKIRRLLDRLDCLLIEPARPSLLHGDLWSGNVIQGNDGRAWLIDPAVYVGHSEADLAMTELFGGFPEPFYRAYREVRPLEDGYGRRRELYDLYHVLNHLNLFGPAYLAAAVRTVLRYQ